MEYRSGKCSQCGAEYKIPASFAHNHARCKVCKGVVRLEPAQPQKARAGADASSADRPPTPKPSAEPAPARAEAQAAPAPVESARPHAPSQPPAPRSERRAEESAPSGAPARRPEPAPKAATRAPHAPEPVAVASTKPPPKTWLLAGAGLLVLVAVLVLLRGKIFGGGDAHGSPPGNAPESAPANGDAGGSGGSSEAGAGRDEKSAGAPREHVPVELAAPERARPKDPSSIDLATVPDFGPTPDTSAAEWSQLKTWAAEWLDPESGAAGTRAKQELMAQERKAVPAILNLFKRQDFATKQGRSSGDQCQKALMQICNGKTFDWRYADEAAGRPYSHPDDVWFCKHVAELWIDAWRQCEQSIESWIKLARLAEEDPSEAERLRDRFGGETATDPSGKSTQGE